MLHHYTAAAYQANWGLACATFGYDAANVLRALADRIAEEHIDHIIAISLVSDTPSYEPRALLYDRPPYIQPTPFRVE